MAKASKKKTELEKRLEADLAKVEQGKGQDQQTAAEADQETRQGEEAPQEVDTAALLSERDALEDQLLRARAEFDNYRKRVARDAKQNRQQAAKALISDLLPVVDHLELALQHADHDSGTLAEGVKLVLKQTLGVLSRHGVEPIAAVGEPFDPNVHEAVMQQESREMPPNTVIQEFQKGYRLGELVLRPTKVVVSAGPREKGMEEAKTAEAVDEATPENGKIASEQDRSSREKASVREGAKTDINETRNE